MGCGGSKAKVAGEDTPEKSEKKGEVQKPENFEEDLGKAALKGDLPSVRYLIEVMGVDKNQADKDGTTAVHWAAFTNQLEVLKYLVDDQHCPIDAKTNNGNTPLHVASVTSSIDVAKFLVDHGADKLAQNDKGQTPADESRTDEMKQIVQ